MPEAYPPVRLAGYRRVSTKEQLDGFGLEVQAAALAGRAAELGVDLGVFTDAGESGSNGVSTRRGLHRALAAVADGSAAGILVPRLDRLARDLILQEQLIAEVRRLGGEVYSCAQGEDQVLRGEGTDPSRKLIRQVLGAVAEYERAMIRLRLEAGIARKKAAGGYAGGRPPFGFRAVDGHLVEIPAETPVRLRLEELRSSGLSFQAVASKLNAEGHLRRGRPWHPEQVRRAASRTP